MARLFNTKDSDHEVIDKLNEITKFLERNAKALERIAFAIEHPPESPPVIEQQTISYDKETGIISMMASPIIEHCDVMLNKIFTKLNKLREKEES
ncbi:MAG: hypothetical protein HQK78_04765, partial [Desulfobacterales bacterium]|nr:hypothetical protein [Desulfobacterales bacterium]